MPRPYDSAHEFASAMKSAEFWLFTASRKALENPHPEDAARHIEEARKALADIDGHLEAVRAKLCELDARINTKEAA
ncbi:hypothetical protein [Henriciella sp.]|uniref:hypothetical protein n=1 Tax=Henriciella sp. TaxID=1968823 RepID=UPI00262EC70A|nr:hypothetical protein [Henriciella sp.]